MSLAGSLGERKRQIFLQVGFIFWQGDADGSPAHRQVGEIWASQAIVLWSVCCLYPWQLQHGHVPWLPDRVAVLDNIVKLKMIYGKSGLFSASQRKPRKWISLINVWGGKKRRKKNFRLKGDCASAADDVGAFVASWLTLTLKAFNAVLFSIHS